VEQLDSLDCEAYEVFRPIRIEIRQVDDEEFVASFPPANISASGESLDDAVLQLKDLLTSLLLNYTLIKREKLGTIPRNQLAVLRSFIRDQL